MIEMEKTEISSLCCRDLIQVAKVARGIAREIPHPQQLMNRWKGLDCFLFRDEGRIIGMVLVNTGIRYFPNSIAVQSLHYRWEYNREDIIWRMIYLAAVSYSGAGPQYICMDLDKRHDINYDLYLHHGFRESIVRSPYGSGHAILLIDINALKE